VRRRAGRENVDIEGLAILIAGAGIGLLLVEATIRRTEVGATLVLGLLVLQESSIMSLSLAAGPVRVYPNDLLFLVLLTAAVARLLRVSRLSNPQRLLVVFGILVAWSLARGLDPYGIPAAVNQARKFLVFAATALYFSTVEPHRDLLERIGRLWLAAALTLCLIVLLRWSGNLLGLGGAFFSGAYERGSSLRVVPASNALIIAQAALIALPFTSDRSRGLLRFLAPALLAFVILLQHRTVWIIVMAGTLYLLYHQRAVTTRVLVGLAATLIVFAGLVFTLFDDPDVVVAEQLSRSAQSTGTFEWRVTGWAALITDGGPDGPVEVAIGQPFGGSWERRIYGGVENVSPHSFYVEPYLRIGLVGLAVLLLVYGHALRGTLLVARGPQAYERAILSPTALHIVISVQLLYFITYTPDAAQGLLLGLGCAMAAEAARPDVAQQRTMVVA
jgi:hypothetical protein